jgi:very-short-patch-repair endonuclease
MAENINAAKKYSVDKYNVPEEKQYASPSVVSWKRPQFGLEKTSQSVSGTGITSTPPGFYSPSHTPSAWQIPTNRKEVYAWCNYWYMNEAYVATSIDFYSNFSMNGYKLDCPNGAVREYFEKLCNEKLQLDKWLPKIAHEYFLFGDAFILLEMDCKKCQGTCVDRKTNQYCDHEGASWGGISVFDPNTIEVSPSSFITQDPIMSWLPNDQLVDICLKKKPEEVYNQIPEEIREQIRAKRPIKLNSIAATHLKCASSPYQTYGTSLIRRLFPTLAYRDKLRQAQWIVAERHILPIKIVKVGSDQRPAGDDDLTNVQEQLSQLANDPLVTLVVHHAFEMDWVGAAGKVLQLTNEYELINDEILGGLQMNKAIVHGEGPNYASAQVGLDALAARLETFRLEIKNWIEQKIFKPVAEWNNFTSEGPKSIEEIIYPKIIFNDMGLKDNYQEIANLLQLRARNEISLQTLHSKFNIDYDDEVEKLRQEEMGNMLTSPEVGVGTEGSEIGAGMGMTPPPMMGGGGVPQMPMEQEQTPSDNGELDQSFMSANNMIKMRKEAVSSFRNIIASVDESFVNNSDTEEDIEYIEMDPEWFPIYNQGCDHDKMIQLCRKNDYIKEIYASKSNNSKNKYRRYFNKVELSLFDAIVRSNKEGLIPLSFVAQYYVGSNPNLSVDGAFPGVKVAIEVDGKEWHNNDEQIQRDMKKDNMLWSLGWIVLRFTDNEIKEKIDQVVNVITRVVMDRYNSSKQ